MDYYKTSPYRQHKSRRSDFSYDNCCDNIPEKTDIEILYHNPVTDCNEWFTVYECLKCGRYYIELDGKYSRIYNLLKYERRNICT